MYLIYCATHNPSGLKYVGVTGRTLDARIKGHLRLPERFRGKFQNYLHATNPADWTWSILAEIEDRRAAYGMEATIIKSLKLSTEGLNEPPKNRGHDRLKQIRAGHVPWNKGKTGVYSETTIERMRLAKLLNPPKRTMTPEMSKRYQQGQKGCKKIRCKETGQVFNSISECAKVMGLERADIRRVLKSERNVTKGYTFEYAD